jgi:hypothetical protein
VKTGSFLTKFWIGRHWWYIDTNHRFSYHEARVLGRYVGIVSYKKRSGP